MKLTRLFLMPILGLMLALSVQTAQAKKPKIITDGTEGVITSVDIPKKTFTFRPGMGKKKDPNAKELTIRYNSDTKFVKIDETGTGEGDIVDLAVRRGVAVVFDSQDNGVNLASKVTVIDLKKKK